MNAEIPQSWKPALQSQLQAPYFQVLQQFVRKEREEHTVYPTIENVYAALHYTPLHDVRAVILGQDPYHSEGQAHGLSFSVPPAVKHPPSLRNILKELHNDLGHPIPERGSLVLWAKQGVLLLNTVLTVRAGQANSHKGRGWEQFTDAIIATVNAQKEHAVFILWGSSAQVKKSLIDTDKHTILESPHPSPLSAHRGFFGSKPFSKINQALRVNGTPEIDWNLSGTA